MVIFGPKSHVFQHLTNCPKLAVLSFIPWVAWVKNPSFIAPEKMSPKVSRKKQWVERTEREERVINGVFPQLSQHHIFGHRSSKLSLENYATKVTNMLLQQIVYLSPSSLVVPPTVCCCINWPSSLQSKNSSLFLDLFGLILIFEWTSK